MMNKNGGYGMDSTGSGLYIMTHFCESGNKLWSYQKQRISLSGENLQGLGILYVLNKHTSTRNGR
jgi:hypothetical protein